MFASSGRVSGIAHHHWVTVEQHEGDVPAPWDAADLHSQSHFHDRQRHELRCRDLVHLQATHSEVSLAALIALQTLPSLVLLPFTGVLIDREDRRHLMLWLDSARGAIIFFVAMLVFTHHVRLWHLYAMNVLVAIGFWMFFPTVNALIQELTPDDKMLDSNSLLLAALQGGWLMAGAVVGFMYNHVGLGGVLLIDCASYAISLACILQVRKGRVTVTRPISELAALASPSS